MGITKEIICLETGETYPSVRATSEAIHYSYSVVLDALKSKRALNGLHFDYTGNIGRSMHGPVKNLETGEVYSSRLDAMEKTGLSEYAIYKHLYRKVKKRRFAYVGGYTYDRG